VGTQNFGNTFPGASVPFGMVQNSPDNGGQGGYDYTRDYIHGFSQTHLSGVGCGVVGELPVMPTTGAVTDTDQGDYRSTFSHANEHAEPGSYRVHLDRYDTDAELTATPRTSWQRYTFPKQDEPANLLFNTGRANMSVSGSHVEVEGDDTIEGWVQDGGFCAGHDSHRVYFTARFDRPFTAHGTWRDDTITPGSDESDNGGGKNGAYVSFDTASDRDVVVKIGLSYTGVAGARANLAQETDGFDFDAVRNAAHATWERRLEQVRIDGGAPERRTAFYTALYHALLHPNRIGDVDGAYMGFDGKVHKAADYTPMANFSLWDTYRPQNQLLELLEPDVARDVALSLLASTARAAGFPAGSSSTPRRTS
jgi:predicted alpha-1,2-mannosidase